MLNNVGKDLLFSLGICIVGLRSVRDQVFSCMTHDPPGRYARLVRCVSRLFLRAFRVSLSLSLSLPLSLSPLLYERTMDYNARRSRCVLSLFLHNCEMGGPESSEIFLLFSLHDRSMDLGSCSLWLKLSGYERSGLYVERFYLQFPPLLFLSLSLSVRIALYSC